MSGASGSGDTYLRLYAPGGAELRANDDNCGGTLSNIAYTVPAFASGHE